MQQDNISLCLVTTILFISLSILFSARFFLIRSCEQCRKLKTRMRVLFHRLLRQKILFLYTVHSASSMAMKGNTNFLHTRQGFPQFSPVLDISVLHKAL